MIDQKPPELFTQRPAHMDYVHEEFMRAESARFRAYRIRRIITIVVLAALIGGGGYEIYAWNRAPGEIPTIAAEGPIKQKPEQPGGIDIPNQDVLAYQQIDSSAPSQAEHLLPPPETPKQTAAENKPAPPNTVSNENLATAEVSTPPKVELPPVTEPVAAPFKPAPAVEDAPVPAKSGTLKSVEITPQVEMPAAASGTKAEDDEPAERPAKAAAGGKKGYRVQIASFADKETASLQMGKLQSKYASQLGNAKLHLAKADLGARGIYYRVQSNPITDVEARDICAALKKVKAGCLLVKP